MLRRRAVQCRAVNRAGAGLGAAQVGGADLYPGGSQTHGGADALGVGDAAGGNHRQVHGPDDLRQ